MGGSPLRQHYVGTKRKVYIYRIVFATNTKEEGVTKQRNETRSKNRKARQVNRLLRKERRKQN